MCVVGDKGQIWLSRCLVESSGFERGDGVGEGTCSGSSLSRTTVTVYDNDTMRSGNAGECVGELFSCPLDISCEWISMLNKCGADQFEGHSIEVFLIYTDDAQHAVTRLVDVFKGEEVSEGDVIDGFAFAIDGDEWMKGIGCFQSIGQLFTGVRIRRLPGY